MHMHHTQKIYIDAYENVFWIHIMHLCKATHAQMLSTILIMCMQEYNGYMSMHKFYALTSFHSFMHLHMHLKFMFMHEYWHLWIDVMA